MGNINPGANHGAYANSRAFYSADAWVEGAAVAQAEAVARLPEMKEIALFPDLHVGKYGPVGMAALADLIYPALIGSDLGCGMALFKTNLKGHKIRLEKIAKALRDLEGPDLEASDGEQGQGMGTIGGGNHFCEIQIVDQICDESVGLKRGEVVCLIHSGSRGFATARLADFMQPGAEGFDPNSPQGHSYVGLHDAANAFAIRNRNAIAARAAKAMRCEMTLICDAPHNVLEVRSDGALHRKGAAKAETGLVPLAGSRDSLSYLLKVRDTSRSLYSISHGAGRRYDRASMHGRVGKMRSARDAMAGNLFGGLVVCEDKALLKEESGKAYKDAAHVAADLQTFGLTQTVATLRPLVTYKVSKGGAYV